MNRMPSEIMLLPYAADSIAENEVAAEFIADEDQQRACNFDDRPQCDIGNKDRPCKASDSAGINATMHERDGHFF